MQKKIAGGYAVAIDKFISDRVLSKITEFNQKAFLNLLRRNRINRLKSVKKAWNLLNSLAWIALRTVVSGILIVKSRLIKMAMLS